MQVFIEYPEEAATELVRQAQELARTNPNPDNIVVDKSRFPNLEGFLRVCLDLPIHFLLHRFPLRLMACPTPCRRWR